MMKKDGLLRALLILLALVYAQAASAQEAPRDEQPRYRMELARVQDSGSDKPEYVFVIGKAVFKTVEALKDFITRLPAGAVLEWSPGCLRWGGEPLLSSAEELEDFKRFCAAHGVEFILHPSG